VGIIAEGVASVDLDHVLEQQQLERPAEVERLCGVFGEIVSGFDNRQFPATPLLSQSLPERCGALGNRLPGGALRDMEEDVEAGYTRSTASAIASRGAVRRRSAQPRQ
jgi:hypothetical protein